MGNKPQILKEQRLLCDHSALSDARVLTEKDREYIQADFHVQTNVFDQWLDEMERGRKALACNYLLLPERNNFKTDKGICGDTGTLTVTAV